MPTIAESQKRGWKINTSVTLDARDIQALDSLKLFEEESRSSVIRRVVRQAAEQREAAAA